MLVSDSSGNSGDHAGRQRLAGQRGQGDHRRQLGQDASERRQDGLQVTIGGAPHTYAASRSVALRLGDQARPHRHRRRASRDRPARRCTPYTPAEAATVAGKVVIVKWTEDARSSAARSPAASTCATPAPSASSSPAAPRRFNAGINGDTVIPGVLLAKSGGDAIRTALAASDRPSSVTGTAVNSVEQHFPLDDDKVNSSSSRGIHAAGNVKPDVAAVGTSVFSTAVGTGNDGESPSAVPRWRTRWSPVWPRWSAPQHPDWTPEQVKAGIMNTAGQDLYVNGSTAPTRVRPTHPTGSAPAGSRPRTPSTNDVLAYNADDPAP